MSYHAVGGKLKLKGLTGQPVKSQPSVGVKRARDDVASSVVPPSSSNAARGATTSQSATSELVVAAAAPAQAAQRLAGPGLVMTSGTAVTGTDTSFTDDFKIGDALEITNPTTGKQEIRVVKMVLSDKSIGINSPFSSDIVSPAGYFILKLARAAEDPLAKLAQAEKQRNEAEKSAFGTYASKGGTEFTYREKKAGAHGGYAIKTAVLDGARTREELLDMRSKKKSDRRC